MSKGLEPSETDIKRVLKDYCKVLGIHIHWNPQGLGSYPGRPDGDAHVKGHIVYIEVKKPGGKLSPAQELFKAQCEADRVPHWVIHSLEELQEKIEATGT